MSPQNHLLPDPDMDPVLAVGTALTDEILARRHNLAIVHHVPGRLRLRLRAAAVADGTAAALVKALEAALSRLPGIRGVRLSPPTLSAVVEYDPARLPPEAWRRLLTGTDAEARAALSVLIGPS